MKKNNMFLSLLLTFLLAACEKGDSLNPTSVIDPGNDPNFSIVANTDPDFKSFSKKVEVFGIPIFAVAKVEDSKLLHAANLMAQYLDNDEDSVVDNPKVLEAMIAQKAFMVMWKEEKDLNINPPDDRIGQDLGNDETHPSFVVNGKTGPFDAALEEVLHIITHAGYAKAYPDIFGEKSGTSLADAMDIARGGHFEKIPSSYPQTAWYSYDDKTCDYNCMATEYIYWALTSILGAQENRLAEIQHEWKLNTNKKVQERDPAIYQLLTAPQFKFAANLPDGTYRQ